MLIKLQSFLVKYIAVTMVLQCCWSNISEMLIKLQCCWSNILEMSIKSQCFWSNILNCRWRYNVGGEIFQECRESYNVVVKYFRSIYKTFCIRHKQYRFSRVSSETPSPSNWHLLHTLVNAALRLVNFERPFVSRVQTLIYKYI